ncbi:MAG: class I SAM-dependent methyltransferase [Planctomycetes bacterium]|nr:class I SAM-dependent methyltransferase [Planctomycetota bacterium]
MITSRPLMETNFGFAASQTLTTALELDLFTRIGEGKNTAVRVARASGCSVRGVRMMLDALTGLKLLRKRGEEYGLPAVARRYLCRQSELYCGEFAVHWRVLRERWGRLTETVKTGRAAPRGGDAASHFAGLVRGLFSLNFDYARTLARHLKVRKRGAMQVLDIAAGSGVWGLHVALQNPRAQVDALDFPEILEITREFYRRYKIADRLHLLPGDLRQVPLEKKAYDLILLGHICHSEGMAWTRKLIRRCGRATRPGGQVVIAEFLPNETRTSPPLPLLFALNMLVNTAEGDVFSFGEYRTWLVASGYERVRRLEVGGVSPLIVARKAK